MTGCSERGHALRGRRASAERAAEPLAGTPGGREAVERALDDHGALKGRGRGEDGQGEVGHGVGLRPHFESLRDRDEGDACGAQSLQIGEQIQRGATPAVEALHDHHVEPPALRGVHDAVESGADAAVAGGGLLHFEDDAQATCSRSSAQLVAREPRILLARAHPMIERYAETPSCRHAPIVAETYEGSDVCCGFFEASPRVAASGGASGLVMRASVSL